MKGTDEPEKDYVQGIIFRAKKRNGQPAKYFIVALYEVDKEGNAVVEGYYQVGDDKLPSKKIAKTFRVPESLLLQMVAGEKSSCPVFWKPPRIWASS